MIILNLLKQCQAFPKVLVQTVLSLIGEMPLELQKLVCKTGQVFRGDRALKVSQTWASTFFRSADVLWKSKTKKKLNHPNLLSFIHIIPGLLYKKKIPNQIVKMVDLGTFSKWQIFIFWEFRHERSRKKRFENIFAMFCETLKKLCKMFFRAATLYHFFFNFDKKFKEISSLM